MISLKISECRVTMDYCLTEMTDIPQAPKTELEDHYSVLRNYSVLVQYVNLPPAL